MTLVQKILWTLERRPWLSAWQLAQLLDADNGTVSSKCKHLADRGVLQRQKGKGPRKGFGYALLDSERPQ